MKILTIAILFTLASCSSTMIKSVGKTSKYAPKNYHEVGQVKYLNAGLGWIVEKRKEDAFKKMHESCNGEYEILKEGGADQFKASYNSYSNDEWVIEFKCRNT